MRPSRNEALSVKKFITALRARVRKRITSLQPPDTIGNTVPEIAARATIGDGSKQTEEQIPQHSGCNLPTGVDTDNKSSKVSVPEPTAVPTASPPTPFDFIQIEHFHRVPDPGSARNLFKQSVIMVEIEVFSYCNRRCWFCPNSKLDRISTQNYMSPELYSRLLGELASVDYSQTIAYSRYNEPLSDRIILDRLAEARASLPNATLHTNTNGDYLTREYLEELYGAGLRSMNIQVYLGNDDRYDHARISGRMQQMLVRLGLEYQIVKDAPDYWIEARLSFRDMSLRMYGRNFEQNGAHRGGLVQVRNTGARLSPCLSPFWHVYIDYNGNIVPCCNIRSDADEHKQYIVTNLNFGRSIIQAYADSPLVSWRRALIGYGEKSGVCHFCHFGEYPATPEYVARQQPFVHFHQRENSL